MITSNDPIYLDYHATTPLDPEVAEEMRPWWDEGFGNPHSGDHWFGWQAHQAIEVARKEVAALIGSDSSEIIFTSGATEANNLAILGSARGAPEKRKQILISAIEHKCVIEAAAALGREGWQVHIIPVNNVGFVRTDVLESLLSDQTAIVSVMAVNNEIGTVQPIERIGQLCHDVGAWFHCDAAQAPAAMPINVLDAYIDLLSLSGHKIYGPKGIGALYVRNDLLSRLKPISYGGGQEQGIRSGTLPTPLCVGLGRASSMMQVQQNTDRRRIAQLCQRLWTGIKHNVPTAMLNGPLDHRHPGNLNICFKGSDASAVLGKLQPALAASTGSACTTSIPEPSHVLTAIGLSLQDAESSIRLGLGRFTREDEIERAVQLITKAVMTS